VEIIGVKKTTKGTKTLAALFCVIVIIVLIVMIGVACYNIYLVTTSDTLLLANKISRVAVLVFGILMAYRISFMIIGILFKAKTYPETEKKYRYACLIPARNEAQVISNLLDSIKKQNYPQDLITMFVIADDCKDNTAEIARAAGAIVFERNNPPKKERRKGYALNFLIKCINEEIEGGIESFDGAFIFDADNVLSKDFFHEMNKAFDQKEYDFFTNYICPKNMTNFWSAYGGIGAFIGNATYRRPTNLLGFSPRIRGNSPLFRTHLIKDGWKWHDLVEDRQFSLDHVAKGLRSAYVEGAVIFDEQVEEFKMFNRQRMRWIHGAFVVFGKYFFKLIGGTFTFRKRSFKKRFSCYDAIIETLPYAALSLVFTVLFPLGVCVYLAATQSPMTDIYDTLISVLMVYGGFYLQEIFRTTVAIVREHRHIRIKPIKLTVYSLLFPLIAIYSQFLTLWSLFVPVKWKRIKRYSEKTAEDIAGEKLLVEYIKNSNEKTEAQSS